MNEPLFHPTHEGSGDLTAPRPPSAGPLLREILLYPEMPPVIQRALGTIALAIVQEGGRLNILSSEKGPSFIEIELRGQKLRFSPTIGADAEEEAVHRIRHKEVVSGRDVASDTVQIALDTLGALIHRESQRRKE